MVQSVDQFLEPNHFISTNKLIAGRYRIGSRIGSGGNSVVFRAFDIHMCKEVAVKILSSAGLNRDSITRFHREARAISQLSHPNLIKILDFGVSENQPYMVLELVKGKTIAEVLSKNGAIPVEDAMIILKQVCSAMSHVHSLGVIHRDLKSSNIMIDGEARSGFAVKVLDFGIAKFANLEGEPLTHTGMVIGTPNYLSPEQARGDKAIDLRSDIYSLGCVAFEMFTGKQPFRGKTYLDTLSNQIAKVPVSLSEANPNLYFSDHLERAVAKALEKDPENRFDRIAQFAEFLIVERGVHETLPVHNKHCHKFASFPLISVLVMFLSALFVFFWLGQVSEVKSATTKISKASVEYSIPDFVDDTAIEPDDQLVKNDYGNNWIVIPEELRGKELSRLSEIKSATRLRADNHSLTDDDLKYITCLPLEVLNLSCTSITDKGLAEIAKMETLQSLILEDNKQITDKGIASLSKHKGLLALSLRGTNITSKSAESISKLTQLKCVNLSRCPRVNNAAIVPLGRLKRLEVLYLGYTGVTGDGFVRGDFRKLEILGLERLKLKDEHLIKLPRVKFGLLLDGNENLTDVGLSVLKSLPGLSYISLKDCKKVSLIAILEMSCRRPDGFCTDNDFYQTNLSPDELARVHWSITYEPAFYDNMALYWHVFTEGQRYFGMDVDSLWKPKFASYSKDTALTVRLSERCRRFLKTSSIDVPY